MAIFDAVVHETKHKCLTAYWDMFVDDALLSAAPHETDWAEWVDNRFEALHKRATQWLIVDLMARVEVLESPNGESPLGY